MTAARERMMDRTRNREHVAALIARITRGDQRARAESRFDDERAERESRDDSIAAREVVGAARRARRELADERAAGLDARSELAMPRRKHDVGSGAEHGDRRD